MRQFSNVDDIKDHYDHIFISPHFDDAALSCGGAMAHYTRQRKRVLVVNVCTRALPPGAELSPFAQYIVGGWGLEPLQAIQVRRLEDRRAMEMLKVDTCELGVLDAIYRHPEAYNSLETLAGSIMPGDTLVTDLLAAVRKLMERSRGATLYAPLGVGLHVDHQAAHLAAQQLAADGHVVAFYEDFPYAGKADALDRRLASLDAAALFVPEIIGVDAVLRRKIRAISAYRSQLQALFGGRYVFRAKWKMRRAVREYAARYRSEAGTYGERLWRYYIGGA